MAKPCKPWSTPGIAGFRLGANARVLSASPCTARSRRSSPSAPPFSSKVPHKRCLASATGGLRIGRSALLSEIIGAAAASFDFPRALHRPVCPYVCGEPLLPPRSSNRAEPKRLSAKLHRVPSAGTAAAMSVPSLPLSLRSSLARRALMCGEGVLPTCGASCTPKSVVAPSALGARGLIGCPRTEECADIGRPPLKRRGGKPL